MEPKKVFCSHRGVDKPAVEAFARRLRSIGIDAWLDKWEIAPGDNIVLSIDQGLRECAAGLIFFSSAADPHRPDEGQWFREEVAALIYKRIEEGCRVIPVLLDAEVKLPEFLKPLARRGIDEFDAIADAIADRSAKPPVVQAPAARPVQRLVVGLDLHPDRTLTVVARRDGEEAGRESGIKLGPVFQVNFAEFLHGRLDGITRGPAEARATSLETALAKLGRELGNSLLTGSVGRAVGQALGATAVGHTLELLFEADDPALLCLPFEAIRLDDDSLLAGHPSVVMARRVKSAPAPMRSALAGPLKILVAVGAPDEDQTHSSVLDLERELQGILDAVAPATMHGNAAVRVLEVGHPEQIRLALRDDQYHVLHLACHGGPGTLGLEDEDGRAVEVSAADLAAKMREAGHPLPLVFLSACSGGSAAGENMSFAQALVGQGVPLVLAMQTRVSDGYAADLAQAFYAELVTPDCPLASRALAQARRRLEAERQQARSAGSASPPEYATASLFCGGEEIPLLDHALDRAPLRRPPVHVLGGGPVPQLKLGELIGRRKDLRQALRFLRDHPATVKTSGVRAGVVLHGIGGVGKSALAGRILARLSEDGWQCAAVVGKFSIDALARAMADGLHRARRPELAPLAAALGDPGADDSRRLGAILHTLQSQPLLLVLDNFESNLAVGGGAYLDPTVGDWLRLLCERAQRGRLLITSRYVPPDCDAWIEPIALAPLSPAQTRKLFLRLPALADLVSGELREIQRRIGGHPRLLEYLDAILRHGRGRLPRITQRLQEAAAAAGVSVKAANDGLDDALQKALHIGAQDVLLDELLAMARENGDAPFLLQAAVSNVPIECAGVAFALGQAEPAEADIARAREALERLADLSLLVFVSPDRVFVHRWTAECLLTRLPDTARQGYFRGAGRYRWWRLETGHARPEDVMEAVDNLLQAGEFDEASAIALATAESLVRWRRSAAASGFVAEVLLALPPGHPNYVLLGQIEADNLFAQGFTDRAVSRWTELHEILKTRAQCKPHRAEYQHDLSVSYNRLGDLLGALGQGEAARAHFEDALKIAQRLAQAEPDRADNQRNLAVSYIKLGDLLRALGQGEAARPYCEKSLEIVQRLARAEPDRADYQRDLSISYYKLGDLLDAQGQGEAARPYYEKSLEIVQRLARAEPDRADYQCDLSMAYNKLGDLLRTLDQGEAARAYLEDALKIAQRLVRDEPERADYQRNLYISYHNLGDLLGTLGQGEAARDYYEKNLEIVQRLARTEPDRADYQRDLSISYINLGDLLGDLGQGEAARAYFEDALKIRARLVQAEPDRVDYQRDLSVSYNRLGDLLGTLGQGDAARDYYEKNLEIVQRLARTEPDRADYQRDLSISYNRLGDLLGTLGQGDAARAYFVDALKIAQRLVQAEPHRADYQRDYARSLAWLATVSDPAQALVYVRSALETLYRLKSAGLQVEELGALIEWCEQTLAASDPKG